MTKYQLKDTKSQESLVVTGPKNDNGKERKGEFNEINPYKMENS